MSFNEFCAFDFVPLLNQYVNKTKVLNQTFLKIPYPRKDIYLLHLLINNSR